MSIPYVVNSHNEVVLVIFFAVAGNCSCTPYLRMPLLGDIMMTSTPPSSLTDDPSVGIVQNCVWSSPKKVNLEIKFANNYALIAN